MTRTLQLDDVYWDISLDASGNLATVTDGQQVAQDVASAILTGKGECWYDTSIGVPYMQKILGQELSQTLVKAQFKAAALTVPEVTKVSSIELSVSNRKLTGSVMVLDADSNPITLTLP